MSGCESCSLEALMVLSIKLFEFVIYNEVEMV